MRVAFACCLPYQRHQLSHEAPVSVAAVLHVKNYGHLHHLDWLLLICMQQLHGEPLPDLIQVMRFEDLVRTRQQHDETLEGRMSLCGAQLH